MCSKMGGSSKDHLIFDDVEYQQTILSYLNTLRKSAQFCDVTLEVGQHVIQAHRAVLASASSFLFELFSGQEAGESFHCKLKDMDYESIDALVNYAYTSRLEIPAEQVKPVYRAAMRLKMSAAASACSDFLAQQLDPHNCLGIRAFANSHSDSALTDKTDKFIQSHIDEVVQSNEFLKLPRVQVDVIGAEIADLAKSKEKHLLDMVVGWVEKSLDSMETLDTLSDHVNVLYLTNNNILHDCKDMDDFSVNNASLIQDYNNASLIQDYKKLKKKKQTSAMKSKDKSRAVLPIKKSPSSEFNVKDLDKEWKVIATQQTSDQQYLCIAMLDNTVCTISLHLRSVPASECSENGHDSSVSPQTSPRNSVCGDKPSLTPLARMSSSRCGFGTAVLEGQIVAVGGFDRVECLNDVESYDICANTWSPLPSMISPRGRFAVGQCDGNLYACGGSNGSQELKTAEVYDSKQKKWFPLPDMSSIRSCAGVAVLDGKVYVVGGWSGQTGLAECEVYDPKTGKWASIASLTFGRSQASVCTMNGQLVAVGGCDAWNCTNSVEVYSPEKNVWTLLPPMNTARRGAGAIMFQDKLYVVGGNDGQSSLATTEVFDPVSQMWSLGPSMNIPRTTVGVSVLNNRLFAMGGFSGKMFLDSVEYLMADCVEWCSYLPGEYACFDDSHFEECLSDCDISSITENESGAHSKLVTGGNLTVDGDLTNGVSLTNGSSTSNEG